MEPSVFRLGLQLDATSVCVYETLDQKHLDIFPWSQTMSIPSRGLVTVMAGSASLAPSIDDASVLAPSGVFE